MAYYNRNVEKFSFNDLNMKYLNKGLAAEVFCNSDIVFKRYFRNASTLHKMKPEIFNILRTIDNPHFIKLIDTYCKMNPFSLMSYKQGRKDFTIDAYTAKYYVDDYINILFENTDYILDNFRELEELFQIFSECGLYLFDLRRKNSILRKDGIVIIDPDNYMVEDDLKKINIHYLINEHNKEGLLSFFIDLCLDAAASDEYFNENKLRELGSVCYREFLENEISENTDITYEISKKLGCVKKPIDFFMKKL